jgi:membrane protease YdiL (CAAX protease family)
MFAPSEFFDFLRRPHYQALERKKTNVVITTLKIYLVSLLILGLINFLNITIVQAFLTLPIDETLTVPASLKEHLWIYFILIVILSPIIEEVIFRLSLVFDPIYFALSTSTLIAVIIYKVSNSILFIISFFLLFFIINRLALIFRLGFLLFWKKNTKYIFYLFSLLFGLVHISNYQFFEVSQYFIVPILIFPQLAIGFLLSFTRLYYENGFFVCILFHILMNLISVSIFLLQNFL